MPFIGNKPAQVPLTSADITDGIIVNADISSTAGITLNKLSGNPNFRNIVINGDMQVAQRATSSASITASGYYTLDRWRLELGTLGTWTMSQSTDVPSGYGFASSLKLDCTTADASPSAGDLFVIQQRIEAQNLQYLKKGTASAVSLTASFWVKSTKTGTFIVALYDNDNARIISKSYTVNTTNTWEFKTVTFAGDTTGALGNDNGAGLNLNFYLGAGSNYTSGTLQTTWASYSDSTSAVGQVNCADSTSNDFLITGVQLEAGTSATDFEFLPYDVNLQRCQRYYELIADGDNKTIGFGGSYEANYCGFHYYPYPKRTTPTLSQTTGTGYYTIYANGTTTNISGFTLFQPSFNNTFLYVSIVISLNSVGFFSTNSVSSKISLDAEL